MSAIFEAIHAGRGMKAVFQAMWSHVNFYVQLLPPDHKLMPKLLAIRCAIEELLAEAPQSKESA